MQFLLPVIFCGFTAWIISWLMMKIIFSPVKAVNFLGIKIQGIVPGKYNVIVQHLGTMADNLFSFNELEKKLSNPEIIEKLKPQIENHVDIFLKDKLSEVFPLISKFIGEKTRGQFKAAFMVEIESIFPTLLKDYISQLEHDLDIKELVLKK